MRIIKCKICGGDLDILGNNVAQCLYCGTKQIIPKFTTDRKKELYERANAYRAVNEYDKAFAVYEQVLLEDNTDAEVYWDLVLCRYGVEYVEDPRTKKRIPTVNRTQFQSVFEDPNYQSALKFASDEQREVIDADAKVIDNIQKGILDISNREQPYDIFICYKEADENGRRTPDSVLAQDLYKELTKEGYKVFFARVSLEDKLGSAYEPYIFAALNSSKVMVVVGTRPDYLDAVWVRNEWSRYLALIASGEKKVLIPAYRGMNPYDLPEEFQSLQAQDMDKLGFMQDLVHGIKKIINPAVMIQGSGTIDIVGAYKKRIVDFLGNNDFSSAKQYCKKVLDIIPEDGETYILNLCAELKISTKEQLRDASVSFKNYVAFQNAMRFGSAYERDELKNALEAVEQRITKEKRRKRRIVLKISIVIFVVIVCSIIGYFTIRPYITNKNLKEAEELADQEQFAEAYKLVGKDNLAKEKDPQLAKYIEAGFAYQEGQYEEAVTKLTDLSGYKNADELRNYSEYYLIKENLNDDNIAESKKKLEELEEAGVEDIDNLALEIDNKRRSRDFKEKYVEKNYRNCKVILDMWKSVDPKSAEQFVKENQEDWYRDMRAEIDSSNGKGRYQARNMLTAIEDLIDMIDPLYKDTAEYQEISKSQSKTNGILLKYPNNPLAQRWLSLLEEN